MARPRKVQNEEPTTGRDTQGTDGAGDSDTSSEARVYLESPDSTADRLLARTDLRDCTLCGERDIPRDLFRSHIFQRHPAPKKVVPQGYYACWSGAEFWGPQGPNKGPCKWLCSVCGDVKWYYGKDKTHGGPDTRLLDRRFGLTSCTGKRYPNHKRYLGKIDGASGPVVFYHEGAPNPEQPVQDDPALAPFLGDKNAKEVHKEAKPKTNRAGSGKTTGRAQRANKRADV